MSLDLFFKKILKRLVNFLSKEDVFVVDTLIHARLADGVPSYQEHLHFYYWENQVDSWGNMPSPIRPSSGDIEIYQRFMPSEIKREHILILGSTPELRDIVAQRPDAKVYIADFSYRMPLEMLKFTKHVDPKKEKWIRDNWFDLPFPEHFFDIILGDLVLQQFPPELEPVLLKKVHSLIKKDGLFIGRFHFLDKTSCSGTIADIVKEVTNSNLTNRERFILLKIRIVWLFTDMVRRELNRPVSAKKFDEFVKDNSISDPLLLEVRDALIADQNSYRHYSVPEEKELIKILSQHFTIIDRGASDDYVKSEIYSVFSLGSK